MRDSFKSQASLTAVPAFFLFLFLYRSFTTRKRPSLHAPLPLPSNSLQPPQPPLYQFFRLNPHHSQPNPYPNPPHISFIKMHFTQLSAMVMAMVLALVSVVAASDYKGHHGATNTVRFGKKMSGVSTWFNGHDLKAVACYGDLMGDSHVNAGDGWHIGAVPMRFYKGGEKTACFECAKITSGRRSVIIRVIDDCAGCAPNQIDLTASAFKTLAPLSQGVVHTKYEFVRCPMKGNLKWPKSPKAKNH